MNRRVLKEEIGDRFQQETKYKRGHLPVWCLDWASKTDTYKRYPTAPKVLLEPQEETGRASLWEVMKHRRSVRHFTDKTVTKSELSQLLWAAQGITNSRNTRKEPTATYI